MSKISFLGGGSFGTALSILLAQKGHKISIWTRDKYTVKDINDERENTKYLPNIKIPNNIFASTNMKNVIKDSKYVIISVPSHAVENVSNMASKYIKEDTVIISVAKGIQEETGKRMSQVIQDNLPSNPIVVLSGPSHAEEVASGIPTVVAVSSVDMNAAKKVQDLFMMPNFRVYTNEDIIGVEISGAVKNIIALSVGILDGLGYGDNTKAALMTRGMSEMSRIGIKLGGRTETFLGLTGMGDLIVTCTSIHSRNRRAGILIGKGASVEETCKEVGMVVEGIKACRAFYKLKEELNVSMPITDMLYRVLYEDKKAEDAVYELMLRDKKDETI